MESVENKQTTVDISNIDFDSFEFDGMVYNKALLSFYIDIYKARENLRVLTYFGKLKEKQDPRYKDWDKIIKNFFISKSYTEYEIETFYDCYITNYMYITNISDNFTDIVFLRSMFSEFYRNIAKPLVLDRIKKGDR